MAPIISYIAVISLGLATLSCRVDEDVPQHQFAQVMPVESRDRDGLNLAPLTASEVTFIEELKGHIARNISELEGIPLRSEIVGEATAHLKKLDYYLDVMLFHRHVPEVGIMFRHMLYILGKPLAENEPSHTILSLLNGEGLAGIGLTYTWLIKAHLKEVEYFDARELQSLNWKEWAAIKVLRPRGRHFIVEELLRDYEAAAKQDPEHFNAWVSTQPAELDAIFTAIAANKMLTLLPGDHLSRDERLEKIKDMVSSGLRSLTYHKQRAFLNCLFRLTPVDWPLLNLLSMIDDLDFSEVLRGGHVRLEDDGRLFELFSKLPHVKGRMSSHYTQTVAGFSARPGVPQRGLEPKSSELFPEFLTGQVVNEEGLIHSWFQLEFHALKVSDVSESLAHLKDYATHLGLGKLQISKWGVSRASEKTGKQVNVPRKALSGAFGAAPLGGRALGGKY